MTNILEGIQYREPMLKFPHWNPRDPYSINDTYGDWQDIPEGLVTFGDKTQLRAKPTFSYDVSVESSVTYTTYKSKDAAMSAIANLIATGERVSIVPSTKIADITNFQSRKLQYYISVPNAQWIDLAGLGSVLTLPGKVKFRVRPDYYHVVDSIDPVSRGSVSFHDVDELAKYVDNRIRTNGLDFSVKKVKY